MKSLFLVAIIALLLNGCVGSKMIQTYGTATSKYAPLNERKGGTVSYSLDARQSVIKKSRETAYKKMYDFCSGPYRIEAEGGKSSGSIGMISNQSAPGVTGFTNSFNSNEWVIHFVCEN